MASQRRGERVYREHELDQLIERHAAEMDSLRLRRETLVLDEPWMLLLFVSNSEARLQTLWRQVQLLLVFFPSLMHFCVLAKHEISII